MPSLNLLIADKYATFALAEVEDDDALKTAVATSLTAATYSGATLNGALANPGPAVMRLPQYVRVATSALAACYNITDPIVFTGTLDGAVVTDSITLTDTDGNEAIDGDQAFDTVVSIAVPAQLKATGQFTFGVTDIVFSNKRPGIQIEFGAAGNIVVEFFDGSTETIVGLEGAKKEGLIKRIVDASTTADPLTVWRGRSHV